LFSWTIDSVVVVVLMCLGRGGFGYLRQWKWWAGLMLSKFSLSLLPSAACDYYDDCHNNNNSVLNLIQRFSAVLLHDCFVDEVAHHSSNFVISLIFVISRDHMLLRAK